MLRNLAILFIPLVAIGCRAPAPSMNVFAPYGSSTVPPPGTGSIGTSGKYYAPGAPTSQTSGGAVGQVPAQSLGALMQPLPGAQPTTSAGAAPSGSGPLNYPVSPASFSPGTTAGTSIPQPLPGAAQPSASPGGDGNSSSSSTLKLNGMRVNDATQTNAPHQQQSATPVNISNLPPANANRAPSFMRFLNPKPGTENRPPTQAAPTTGAATGSTGTWQTR